MKNFTASFIIFSLFQLTTSAQETITVHGTVIEAETGMPVPTANVVQKGTSNGVMTTFDGDFTINVPSDAVLVISYVGFATKEVAVNGQEQLKITLEQEASALDEIVVVGYGSKSRAEMSSAVTVVSEEELEGVSTTDLSTMLQGKVPGLTVSNVGGRPGSGNELNMTIRGAGSIGAGYSPLIVVDGIIGGDVNPQDIASVSVLRDAAATGLYGSRAANGVIIITTKKGQSGKTRISYNGQYGPTLHRDVNFRRRTPQERYDFMAEGYKNYYDDQVAAGDPFFTEQSFEEYLEGELPESLVDNATDWASLMERTGYVNRHSLSVSGGSDKTIFYLSGTYFYELGTFMDMDYEEMNFRANVSHDINEKFTIDARFNVGKNERPNDVGIYGSWWQYRSADIWDPDFEEDGITPVNPREVNWFHSNQTNHLYDRQFYTSFTRNLHLSTDLKLAANITDWMTVTSTNRVYFSGRDDTEILDKDHYLGAGEAGRITQDFRINNSFTTSNQIDMNYNFGSHGFSGILGQEYNYLSWKNTLAAGSDIISGLTALSSAGGLRDIGGNTSETGFMSYFGQADYSYESRYFLVGSLRWDASSRFGEENRWGTFYSFGASWNINREKFLEDVSWIDLLKIRTSYGKTGNANIQDYLALGTFTFSSASSYNGNAGGRPSRLANPFLTWEEAYSANLGIEFSFLNRFSVSLDLYNIENHELLQNVPLPATTGFSGQQQNIGSIRNRGFDFAGSGTIIDGEFKWVTGFNLNVNRNKVLELHGGEDIVAGSTRAPMLIREGYSLRNYYMREWAGVDPENGDPLWVKWEDSEGNVIHEAQNIPPANITTTNEYNEASHLFVGSAYPDFTGGLSNDFIYKNFTLSTVANFTVGNLIYGGVSLDGSSAHMPEDAVRWREPGDIATEPRNIYGGNREADRDNNSRHLHDGSFFRIQNITLSYLFAPESFEIFNNLELYTSVDYPVMFTDFPGMDPDINIEDPNIANLLGTGRISPPTRILFGAKIGF